VGGLDFTLHVLECGQVATAIGAEEFALDQQFRNGGTVDLDEGAVRQRRTIVDHPCD
jgi:hypothetical protein